MTRNVEGMQETGKWLRHGLNSFPWVAPFSSAGCATRAQIFGARTSRVKRKSWLKSPEIMRLALPILERSEEHTSELQSLMRTSHAVYCLNKKKLKSTTSTQISQITSTTISTPD